MPHTHLDASVSVNAPAPLVFDRMADLSRFNDWNPFPSMDPTTTSTVGLTRPVITVPTEQEIREQRALEAWNAMPVRKRLTLSRLPRWLWPSNDPRDIRRSLVQFTRHVD